MPKSNRAPHFLPHIRIGFTVRNRNGRLVHSGLYWLDDDTERRAFGQRCNDALIDGMHITTYRAEPNTEQATT